MKEYKVVSWSMSLTNNNKRFEDLLNTHAKDGWQMVHVGEHIQRVVFERDKNR